MSVQVTGCQTPIFGGGSPVSGLGQMQAAATTQQQSLAVGAPPLPALAALLALRKKKGVDMCECVCVSSIPPHSWQLKKGALLLRQRQRRRPILSHVMGGGITRNAGRRREEKNRV